MHAIAARSRTKHQLTTTPRNGSSSRVMAANHESRPQLSLNGRPLGLRRQPTKYPHGLSINVQHIDDREMSHQQQQTPEQQKQQQLHNYVPKMHRSSSHEGSQPDENAHRKYKISMISKPETMAEIQVRRHKYAPPHGSYFLDGQEPSTKASLALLHYAKHYCQWRYLRWPSIFLASVLLFFGLITYCIWLHDVSVARSQYLKRRIQFSADEEQQVNETDAVISLAGSTIEMQQPTTPTTSSTTMRSHRLQESTLLRAISTRSRQLPKEQKLTTREYDVSKGAVDWEKPLKQDASKAFISNSPETTTMLAEEAILSPESVLRFTSGHQNSFGIPIEDDERILRIINGLFSTSPVVTAPTKPPFVKVSPTIPPIRTQTLVVSTGGTTMQESGCYSTKLPMCRGVLDYDLTNNSSPRLSEAELEAYQSLIRSNCSARAAEFVCATLEPECRPSHIGVLPPCRRICKAILEACSVLIANSDTLTATFDCHLYPDSNDPHKCEDPTRRRGYCYDGEYECYDRSCIPSQWQCDNIKDCASGEEEDDCIVCDLPDEFRCRSNEKCVPESVRCDQKYDCFDGSDEEGCEEYGSGDEADDAALNSFPRIFSYASFLSPNQTNEKLYSYITATTDDESGTKFRVHGITTNQTQGISKEEVTNNVPGEGPKGFVNFRDSKEIMMTSDSENKFKYSSARANRTTSKLNLAANTTPLQAAGSFRVGVTTDAPPHLVSGQCASHELRCVSGTCITVSQLCDKKADCPDGADELACVYKERSRSTKKTTLRPPEKPTTTRPHNRNIRTTSKRRVTT